MKPILYITLSAILGFIFGVNSEPATQPIPTVNLRASKHVVLYFNAEWNAANHYAAVDKLTGCNIQRYMIDKSPALQKKFNVNHVPCLILFKDGVEVKRWEAGISMKITAPATQIQSEIK